MKQLMMVFGLLFLAGCGVEAVVPEIQFGTNEAAGNWVSGCRQDKANEWENGSVFIAGDTIDIVGTEYSDSGCQNKVYHSRMVGKYTVGSTIGSEGAHELNYKADAVYLSVYTSESAAMYNAFSMCGRQDWSVGVERECPSFAGSQYYSIYKVEGNQMFLGKADAINDTSTPEKRPQTLDRDKPMSRQ